LLRLSVLVSELEGIQDEAPAGTKVTLISDCTLDPATAQWQFINPNGKAVQGLQGQYFTTPDLSGTPAVTRIDKEVNFDWEQGQIPVSQNQAPFSAKWTGQIVAQISGDQVFKVCADGGVRLIVNGQTSSIESAKAVETGRSRIGRARCRSGFSSASFRI
jgi:beta-glucosidase